MTSARLTFIGADEVSCHGRDDITAGGERGVEWEDLVPRLDPSRR